MQRQLVNLSSAVGTHLFVKLSAVSIAILLASTSFSSVAADPTDYLPGGDPHRLFRGDYPPGVVGQARLAGRGPVAGYYQPVAVSGPEGVRFALPQNGTFASGEATLRAGMLVGAIYRFQITAIPGVPGAELYPTIEVIDRTYPPPGLANRYPITINLDEEDLEAALSGQMVTRVIFLEDPETAMPVPATPTTSTPIQIAEYQDALEVADRFGRPVAIVRIGSLTPPRTPELLPQFYFGYPVWLPVDPPQPPSPQPQATVP